MHGRLHASQQKDKMMLSRETRDGLKMTGPYIRYITSTTGTSPVILEHMHQHHFPPYLWEC